MSDLTGTGVTFIVGLAELRRFRLSRAGLKPRMASDDNLSIMLDHVMIITLNGEELGHGYNLSSQPFVSLSPLPEWPIWRPSVEFLSSSVFPPKFLPAYSRLTFMQELVQVASGSNLDAADKRISPSVVKTKTRYLPYFPLRSDALSPAPMAKTPSSAPCDDHSTTQTNTDCLSTETSSNALPQPDPPPFPNNLALSPSPNPSSGTSLGGFATKPSKSLNVIAVAIGVTGAVLLLAVCGVIIFYLRRRKQKKKVAPSAEFMHVAARWKPRTPRETNSPTSLAFIPNGAAISSSSLEPLRHPFHVSSYSPPPTAASSSSLEPLRRPSHVSPYSPPPTAA